MIVEGATMTVGRTRFSIVKVKPAVLISPDIELTRQSFQVIFYMHMRGQRILLLSHLH